MDLLDDNDVICATRRLSVLCPNADGRKKCHRRSSQNTSATLQRWWGGEWSTRSHRAIVLMRVLLVPPH